MKMKSYKVSLSEERDDRFYLLLMHKLSCELFFFVSLFVLINFKFYKSRVKPFFVLYVEKKVFSFVNTQISHHICI